MEYARLIETGDPDVHQSDPRESLDLMPTPSYSRGRTLPFLNNIDVENMTDVRIGDTFIRRTVIKEEVGKGRLPANIWCKIMLCLSWIFIVIFGVAFFIIVCILPERQTRIDVDIFEPWYYRREQWLPKRVNDEEFLKLPINYVIIMHSGFAVKYCDKNETCFENLKEAVSLRRVKDVQANFLVGGEGSMFEVRGANVRSPLILKYEDQSITIMFIGNYVKEEPNQVQFDHVDLLLSRLVQTGVLNKDYQMLGSCQLTANTISPGPNLLKRLHAFNNYNSNYQDKCKSELPSNILY